MAVGASLTVSIDVQMTFLLFLQLINQLLTGCLVIMVYVYNQPQPRATPSALVGYSLGARPFSQRGEGEERKKVWRLLQHFRVLLECQ